MTQSPRPFSAEHPSQMPYPPGAPFDVAVVGAGRVGCSLAAALRTAGHRVIAELGRADDPSPIQKATVVVVAVPDDALDEAVAVVGRLARPGTVVVHTSGSAGLWPLRELGPLIAAIHPAVAVARRDQSFDGVVFGVTSPQSMRRWCETFVGEMGGRAMFVPEEDRSRYHAALTLASNFAVSLAADAARLLGGHDVLVPLLRATVENLAELGPAEALTGPVVRGDTGTVRAHLAALPVELLEVYSANARRVVALAASAGRLAPDRASEISALLETVEPRS